MIKGDEKFKSIPVIVFTTSGSERDIRAYYESGASAYMQKPMEFEGLVETLRQFRRFWLQATRLPEDGSVYQ